MRILLIIFFFFLAAGGTILAIRDNLAWGLGASPVLALSTASTTALTGTIDYTKNNVGAVVPYLIYSSGGTKAKELVFDSASRCVTPYGTYLCTLIAAELPSYYPGFIRATGQIDAETLLVTELAPG